MNPKKIWNKLNQGSTNLQFDDLKKLIEAFGFRLDRIKGSHHTFVHQNVPENICIQKVGGEAKPYQIRQCMELINRYNLPMEDEA